MDRSQHGRALLARWEAAKPTNFYEDDRYLRMALRRRLGPARLAAVEPALRQAGADSAGVVSRASTELDRPEHLPRLEGWSSIGERSVDVVFHPAHHEVGRRVWRSGILAALGEPGNMTLHAALTYLFALNGEVPHLCSVACTAGLIKAIQRSGTDWMKREWLPRLLDRDYDRRWHASQMLTEVQGGSDVGANACVARRVPGEDGVWHISGEKWFCSNLGADLYALSARPEGAPEGTPGIGLFVVPRRLPDGRPNGILIRRLKNKLGTRTLPTGEIDFQDARAHQLGRLEEGFKLLMGIVINTSRLEVGIDASGIMRRAWVEAWHYARLREAFGQRLVDFPAVRQQLAEMRVLATAGLASTLFAAATEDRLALAGTHPEEDALYRTAVNVNKYACSIDAGLVVHHAIEILGGNGTIEDFSPLPRLYREVPVQESWEGPHNTLMSQVLRDSVRAKMHHALLRHTQELLLGVEAPALVATRDRALTALDDARGAMDGLLRADQQEAAYHVRGLVTRIARIVQVALLLEDAQHAGEGEGAGWLAAAAQFLLNRSVVPGYDPREDPGYPGLIRQILED
ncbi:MAG: acyl-CoA dehydrogenase family protein [Candidatus Rokubacteria bacterium]|nr:acyl-CoA dehydrogenase family protein [Candidatus Rokubacteria bacterium]